MMSYWSSFARTGRPQAANEPEWPAYGSAAAFMDFRDSPRPSTHLYQGMYALHEAAVCRRASQGLAWNWNVGVISPVLTSENARCKVGHE